MIKLTKKEKEQLRGGTISVPLTESKTNKNREQNCNCSYINLSATKNINETNGCHCTCDTEASFIEENVKEIFRQF